MSKIMMSELECQIVDLLPEKETLFFNTNRAAIYASNSWRRRVRGAPLRAALRARDDNPVGRKPRVGRQDHSLRSGAADPRGLHRRGRGPRGRVLGIRKGMTWLHEC